MKVQICSDSTYFVSGRSHIGRVKLWALEVEIGTVMMLEFVNIEIGSITR